MTRLRSRPLPNLLLPPALLAAALLILLGAGDAAAKGKGKARGGSGGKSSPYLPPKKKLFAGVSDTGQTSDFTEYGRHSGSHPAVMQSFESWGYVPREALNRWRKTRTRGMLSLSTSRCWGCDAVISNQSIAQGKGDRYVIALAKALAKRKRPTYIRLFPEMNGHWNGYSAFHGNGRPRGEAYSTKNFKLAWKRFVLIVRGGKARQINRKLRRLGMPKLQVRTGSKLVRPKVAIAWVPQAAGSPDVAGNQPQDYFPGYRYVDWVGADTYGKFESLAGVSSIYAQYRKAPFMVGEWSPWDRDRPAFADRLFDFVERKGRARMIVYYQGFGEGAANEFELADYPASRKLTRRRLNDRRYAPYAPEEKKGGKRKGDGKRGKKGKGKRR